MGITESRKIGDSIAMKEYNLSFHERYNTPSRCNNIHQQLRYVNMGVPKLAVTSFLLKWSQNFGDFGVHVQESRLLASHDYDC